MMKYFAIQSVERVNTSQELFLQECRASYENVWSSLHCCLGWVAACSAPGSLTLAIANAAPISIVNGQRLLTCVYLSKINNHLYITCGNETGEIATYSLSLKGSQVKLNYELKVQLLSRSSVLSISRSSKNDLWAVQATSVSLLRNNILCRVNTTLNTAANATFISAQLLSTVHGGVDAVLAVAFSSPSASTSDHDATHVHVYMVDAKCLVGRAEQMKAMEPNETFALNPVVEFPFTASGSSGTAGSGAGSSLFGFSLSSRQQQPQGDQERPARCEVDPDSVRSISRVGESNTGGGLGGIDAAEWLSFEVHVQGSHGTEVAAAYTCARQRALDRLCEEGCEVFSRPCSALAAPQPTLADLTVTTQALGDPNEKTTRAHPVASSSSVDALPLWRCVLQLGLVPTCRARILREQVRVLDETTTAASSSSSAKTSAAAEAAGDDSAYFVVARAVLAEAALSAGLGHLLAAYVLRESAAASSPSGYLLADVRRFHEWAMDASSTPGAALSMQASLEGALHTLCQDRLVHALLTESTRPPEHLLGELKQLHDLAAGLQQVTEALLVRKMSSLADHGDADDVRESVIAAGGAALQVQVAELRCLQRILSLLQEVARTPHLSLRALLTGDLHHRSTSGKVHAPSSSSAAAASAMQCEYHFVRASRAEAAALNGDLPDPLHASPEGLLGVLCSMLDPACQRQVEFLLHAGGSAQGVNLNTLSHAVAELLLLPLTALRQAVAEKNKVRPGSSAPRAGEGNVEATLANTATVAFSVVVFFLAEMHHLSLNAPSDQQPASRNSSSSNSMDVAEQEGASAQSLEHQRGRAVAAFVRRSASAASVPATVHHGVLALWQVEAGIDVSHAVRTLCNASDCTVAQDETVLCAVIRRLLSASRLAECQDLLTYLRRADNAIVGTSFFVMATAVAIGRADQWKFCWHSAKELSYSVHPSGSAEGTELRRQLVQLFVRYAMLHDCVGDLLNSPLDREEVAVVEEVLRALAESDVQNCRCPSPAVDVCVAFLLRETKFDDAIELHERHAGSVLGLGQGQEHAAAMQQQLDTRRALVVAHASVPTIPVGNFRA